MQCMNPENVIILSYRKKNMQVSEKGTAINLETYEWNFRQISCKCHKQFSDIRKSFSDIRKLYEFLISENCRKFLIPENWFRKWDDFELLEDQFVLAYKHQRLIWLKKFLPITTYINEMANICNALTQMKF